MAEYQWILVAIFDEGQVKRTYGPYADGDVPARKAALFDDLAAESVEAVRYAGQLEL